MMTFDDFVAKPSPLHMKYQRMLALLPKFELGKSNGRTLAEMCQFLSENDDEFRGMKADQIQHMHKHVRTKYSVTNSGVATAAAPQPTQSSIPAPAPATQPPPVVDRVQPANPIAHPVANPITNTVTTPAANPIAKPATIFQLPKPSDAEITRLGAEAKARLTEIGIEGANWAEAQGYLLTRGDREVLSEWIRLEPGRREMISDLLRAAYRAQGSELESAAEYSDGLIFNFINRGPKCLGQRMVDARSRANNAALRAKESAFTA